MTTTQMITKFQNLVDDTIDSQLALQILNDAKNEIEGEHIWEVLKSVDTSKTVSTSEIDLPDRFALPIKLSVGEEYFPYTLIAFEDQREFRDQPYSYYIDFANLKYKLLSVTANGDTIYFFHTKYTDDLTDGQTWSFPTRFHDIIPIKMAMMYYSIDAGEKSRAWDDRWSSYYTKRLGDMKTWDAQLKMRANRGRRVIRQDLPKQINNF